MINKIFNFLPSTSLNTIIMITSLILFLFAVVVKLLSPVQLCNPMDYSMPGFSVLHYLRSLLKFMSSESVMLSNHLILWCPLLLWPSTIPSKKIFSKESALHIRWPKYWSLIVNNSLSNNIQGWFPLGLTGLISWWSKGHSRIFFCTTIQKNNFFGSQSSLWTNTHTHTWLLEKPWL